MNHLTRVRVITATLAISLCGAPLAQAQQTMFPPKEVRCVAYVDRADPQYSASPANGFPKRATCPNPFVEGIVDGQWIGLVVLWSGGNSGAFSALAFSVGFGGNGVATNALGTIKGAGDDPMELTPVFHNGKLWIINDIHLPGQAHFQLTNEVVQQFGFHGGKLVVEKIATVLMNATAGDIESALRKSVPP